MPGKKKISVIALDPRAGESYKSDIAQLFADAADISVFSMLDGSAAGVLDRADLFVASTDAYGSPEELMRHIPIDSQTMAVEVSFRWSELRRLKELPAGSRVLFVNMTQTMAREAIAQLEQFGVTHIQWIPFYPGAPEVPDVHIAVTPDELRYVPPGMETVIDLGQRVCTSGMMIEIALRLGLESLLEGPAFQRYAQEVATSNYSFDRMFARSIRLESQFHILMESLEDGVVGVNEKGEIFACSRHAEEMTLVSAPLIQGRRCEEVFPYIPFAQCQGGEGGRGEPQRGGGAGDPAERLHRGLRPASAVQRRGGPAERAAQPAFPQGPLREIRLCRRGGPVGGHCQNQGDPEPHGPKREPRPAHRRDGHREGALCPCRPSGVPPVGRPFRSHQRGGFPGEPAGERAVRL